MVDQPRRPFNTAALTGAGCAHTIPSMLRPRRSGIGAIAALLALAAGLPSVPAPRAETAPDRARVVIRTLVIDGMGTRTVDTDTARIPFGSRGLLIKQVPYAGRPLSFRLSVAPGPPQAAGIPLALAAEIWSGTIESPPPAEAITRRDEMTVLAPESSYLLEVDHDPVPDRRVVLSITARPMAPGEEMPIPPVTEATPVQVLIEVTREVHEGDRILYETPDVHLLDTLVGRPVTYSSGVKVRPAGARGSGRHVTLGVSVTVTAQQAAGGLITVTAEVSGADYTDGSRDRIEPFVLQEVHTVASGASFEMAAAVPPGAPSPSDESAADAPPGQKVVWRVRITPMLV